MTTNKSCHYIQDALAVLKFVESSLYPLFQQDSQFCLVKRPISRHKLLHFILKLMKLCATKNSALPLDDAASVFYHYLSRMVDKVHGADKMMSGEVGSSVDTKEIILNFTAVKLGVVIRAYTSFHTQYIVSAREVTPLVPNHNVLIAFDFLQNIGCAVGNYWNSDCQKGDNKCATSCGNQQSTEDNQLLDINTDCLVTLTHSLLSSKPAILACLQLLSLTVEGCVRNLPPSSVTPKLFGLVSLVSSTMARISKFILRIIKRIINQHKFDYEQLYELPELLKFALSSFDNLAHIVKKICPAVLKKSTKVLERTATYIGSMGGQLTQRKLYRQAIELLSPMWPFPRMKELVQYVKHHETLCESYINTGRIEKAWLVAGQAITADYGFMSDCMVEVFGCILENHKSIFHQTECLKLLKTSMDALLKNHLFNDISSLGSLLYFDIHTIICSKLKINCGILMQKAIHFFNKWTQWYSSVGREILTLGQTLRANLSIRFLRKVAEIATVCFQNVTAVKSLTEAYSLAHKMKQWDTVKDLIQTMITLMPQLGLQFETANHWNDRETMDIFLDSMSLENKDPLKLVAIATYHLNTGQLQKFQLARKAVYFQVSLASQRGDDQLSIDFAHGVIKMLEAKFLMMPGSRKLEEENGYIEPMQTALEKVRSSHWHFDKILRSHFESHFQQNKDEYDAVGPWQFIHQYLHSCKLTGELCLYSGLSSEAEMILFRGLKTTRKFCLYTWEATFCSRLIELVLISNELDIAVNWLTRTQNFICHTIPTLESGPGTCCGKFIKQCVSSDNLACECKVLNLEKGNSSLSCENDSKKSRQSELASLMGDSGLDRFVNRNQKPLQNCLTLTDISSGCSCCQPEIIGICISLMSQQAEILWRQQKSMCAMISLLQLSMDMSHQFMTMSPCTNLIDYMAQSGWRFSHLSPDMKVCNRILAETAYKCAEIYVHSLCINRADSNMVCDHVQPTIDNILSLLETAETMGKKVGEFHVCNTVVASALLLRSQLKYLKVLQILPHDDDGQEGEISSSNECSPAIMKTITSAVNLATKKKEEQDNKRFQMMLSVREDSYTFESDKLFVTVQTNSLSSLLPNHLVLSSLAASISDHHADNVIESTSWKSYCTVGVMSNINTVSSTKDVSAINTVSSTKDVSAINTVSSTKDVPDISTVSSTKDVSDISTKDVSDNTRLSSTMDVPDISTKDVSDISTVSSTKDVSAINTVSSTKDVSDINTVSSTKDVSDISTKDVSDISTKDVSAINTVSNTKDVYDISTKDVSDNTRLSSTMDVPDISTVCSSKDVSDISTAPSAVDVSDMSTVSSAKDLCDYTTVLKNTTVSNNTTVSMTKNVSYISSVSNNTTVSNTKDSRFKTGSYCAEAEEKPDFNDNLKGGPSFAPYIQDRKSVWLERLTAYFPTVAACKNGTQRMSYLQTALQQLHEFPHFWLYKQTSQSIALCLWEQQMVDAWAGNNTCSKQTEISAYLTESMHVTFQHKMAYNFSYKLSTKHFWESDSQEESKKIDKQAMKEALNVLRFGNNVEKKFQNRLALIPADWTVVQMSIVDFDPANSDRGQIFVTRLQHDQEPITVGLPVDRCQILSYARRAFEEVMLKCHVDCYPKKCEHLLEIMQYLQEVFLGGHKWLLRGQLECLRQSSVQKFLEETGRRAVNIILHKHGYHICYMELRNVLEILIGANEADVLSLTECMWPPHIAETLAEICLDVQVKVVRMCGGQWSEKRGPVVLILDNKLTCFPWESMPDLIADAVTRIPSLANLIALWTLHTKMTKSPFQNGVERSTVTANVDILAERAEQISEQIAATLKQYQGLNVCTERIHECAKKLEPVLKNSSLYFYFGHGWMDYSLLENIHGRAFAFLLTCCGGVVDAKGKFDGDGAPLYFLMAGSPAVMGNLWVVRSQQCRIMASHVFSYWMSRSGPISIREFLGQWLSDRSMRVTPWTRLGSHRVIYRKTAVDTLQPIFIVEMAQNQQLSNMINKTTV